MAASSPRSRSRPLWQRRRRPPLPNSHTGRRHAHPHQLPASLLQPQQHIRPGPCTPLRYPHVRPRLHEPRSHPPTLVVLPPNVPHHPRKPQYTRFLHPSLSARFSPPPMVFEQFRTPMRPLEPFSRYLHPTGDEVISERNYVAVLFHYAATSPSTEKARTVPASCRQGHRSYRSQSNLRTQAKKDRDNCPVCEHRSVLRGFSDMATTHPWMAREFHPTRNSPHTPHTVFAGSSDKFSWVRSKGHDFDATASNRSAARSGCPVCLGRVIDPRYNTLTVLKPAIASEWHPTFNTKQSLVETTPAPTLWRGGYAEPTSTPIRSRSATGPEVRTVRAARQTRARPK